MRATRKMTRASPSGRSTLRTATTSSGCSASIREASSTTRAWLSGPRTRASMACRSPGLSWFTEKPDTSTEAIGAPSGASGSWALATGNARPTMTTSSPSGLMVHSQSKGRSILQTVDDKGDNRKQPVTKLHRCGTGALLAGDRVEPAAATALAECPQTTVAHTRTCASLRHRPSRRVPLVWSSSTASSRPKVRPRIMKVWSPGSAIRMFRVAANLRFDLS